VKLDTNQFCQFFDINQFSTRKKVATLLPRLCPRFVRHCSPAASRSDAFPWRVMMHRQTKSRSKPSPTNLNSGLNSDEAAAYLGVSSSYVNKLRCVGGGPRYAKIGRRVTYRVSDLDAWREKYLVMSTSQRRIEI